MRFKYFNNIMIWYIIVLLIIIILFLLKKKHLETFETFEQKLIFITFGGGGQNYYEAANRVTNEVKELNLFNDYITYTDKYLKNDTQFWNTHASFIENNKRGYGYWLWKPYIIMKTLNVMNKGDVLLYLDGGCEVFKGDMNSLIEKCIKNDILYTLTGTLEKEYTKTDLLIEMKLNNNIIKDSQQYQASAIFLKKNEKIMRFVKEWYMLCCNYHLIDDSKSIKNNDSTFIEHRHDQSVFSLLIKKYNYDKEENMLKNSSPINISRKRNG